MGVVGGLGFRVYGFRISELGFRVLFRCEPEGICRSLESILKGFC